MKASNFSEKFPRAKMLSENFSKPRFKLRACDKNSKHAFSKFSSLEISQAFTLYKSQHFSIIANSLPEKYGRNFSKSARTFTK